MADRAAPEPRAADYERYTDGAAVGQRFAYKAVVAEHLAVIADEHYYRVVQRAVVGERLYQPAYLVVDMGYARVVAHALPVDLLLVERAVDIVEFTAMRGQRGGIIPVAFERRRELFVAVHVEVDLGRIIWRMRAHIRRHQEERLVTVAPAQEVYRTVGRPVGRMQPLLIAPRPRHP